MRFITPPMPAHVPKPPATSRPLLLVTYRQRLERCRDKTRKTIMLVLNTCAAIDILFNSSLRHAFAGGELCNAPYKNTYRRARRSVGKKMKNRHAHAPTWPLAMEGSRIATASGGQSPGLPDNTSRIATYRVELKSAGRNLKKFRISRLRSCDFRHFIPIRLLPGALPGDSAIPLSMTHTGGA